MATQPDRRFVAKPAERESMPLLIGLTGPSGGGKSFSALRLATGIQSVVGGEIYFIDTENKRGLHYADKFTYQHVDMQPPFGSLDYLAAMEFCVEQGAKTIIVDSLSHEHDGPGGMIEFHEQELQRITRGDESKRKSMQMLAWAEPKARRRRLINGMIRLNANIICCFRAKNTSKPVKKDGRTEVEQLGFMPIAGEEFVFEQTLNCLLLPGSGGVPTWHSEQIGERTMIKLPEQFKTLANRKAPLDEETGARLARWAAGKGIDERPSRRAQPEQRTFEANAAQPDPIASTLTRIDDATDLSEVDAIDRETEAGRAFLTDEQNDRLDEALAKRRAELRETVAECAE